VDDKQYHSTLL